jgi:hypothetical protein
MAQNWAKRPVWPNEPDRRKRRGSVFVETNPTQRALSVYVVPGGREADDRAASYSGLMPAAFTSGGQRRISSARNAA